MMGSESLSRRTLPARRAQGEGVDSDLPLGECETVYTLLGVRPDGVASIVDLVAAEDLLLARRRARALLAEHLSCSLVEVWREGALVEQLKR